MSAAPSTAGGAEFSAAPVIKSNLREQVTSRILTAVFEGQYASGQRLVVQRLADQFQVSPTPVREALVELAAFGMVELIPNRGAVVCPFGRQQVREISQIRRVLEVEATRGACARATPEEVLALHDELLRLRGLPCDEVWDRDIRAADNLLHGTISARCGSERLRAEINRYLTLFRALRDVSHLKDAWTNYSRSNDVPEHLAITAALLERQEQDAAEAMDRHIRSAAQSLEDVMFSGGVQRPSGTA